MSRTNPSLSGNFFKALCLVFFLSGCNVLKTKLEATQSSPLQKVFSQQKSPPFALENYQAPQEKYTVLSEMKTLDKYNLTHLHHYLHVSSPLKLTTLIPIMEASPAQVHWFYMSQQKQALDQSTDLAAFSSLVFCQTLSSRQTHLINSPFKKDYTYQNTSLSCELNYVP